MRTASKTRSYRWYGRPLSWDGWYGGPNPLPADMSLGNYDLTLANVVVGSRVHIASQNAAHVFVDEIAESTDPVYALGVYGVFAMNQLRIRIRKASETPFYHPFETLTTAVVGAQSIYVGQIPDE